MDNAVVAGLAAEYAESTGTAVEYVADSAEAMAYTRAGVHHDLDRSAELLVQLLSRRITAVAESSAGELGLMLSGGVDSILVAAVSVRLGLRPCAVTVLTEHDSSSEDFRSRAAAEHLGINHRIRTLTTAEVNQAATKCIGLLGTDELWEVTSAVPVRAAFEVLPADEFGAILTGAGADALFMGGDHLSHNPAAEEGLREFRARVRNKVQVNFTRQRLIPDYYERLLGDNGAARFIQVFQTTAFWQFAMSICPSLLFGVGPGGIAYDKYLLRYTANRLGVPGELVWTTKSPLQVSSGVIGSAVDAARAYLASIPSNRVYSDPRSEPLEHVAARLYLRLLQLG